eukprot:s1996_g10.t1
MWRLFEVTGKRKAPVVEQLQNPVQEDSVRQVWRSKGKAHSLAIVRGIAAKQVKQEAARLKASVDLQGHQLASVVFSDTGRAQNSAALRKVQESLQFLNEEGELTHYAASCRQDSTMSRMRIIGLVSHVRAQAAALLDLFSKSPVGHGIFVRQFDDTNIMVAPGSTETQQQGRSGHRRVSQLLGMIQHFCIRRVAGYQDGELEMLEWAQVHCPSQANAATLMDRVGRWTLCACQGTSEFLGGEALDGLLSKVPMKVVINCLVCMAHASGTSLFRQRLEGGIASLVKAAKRSEVLALPQTTRDAVGRNAKKLKLFSTYLAEDDVDLILSMLNADWAEPMDEGLVHMCTPDCCTSDMDFQRRMTSALRAAFGGGFEVPLLYRPLTNFMDQVSYAETAQTRLRLKSIGLELPGSKCPSSRDEVIEVNLNILIGGAGQGAIAEYRKLLESPATADNWFADLGVSKDDSLPLLLIGICEAWRRLVLPYSSLPWQLLRVARMDVDDALDLVAALQKQHLVEDDTTEEASYQAKAFEIQRQRDELSSQALQHQNSTVEATATGTGLRQSQIKRLNGARLDGTLQQVSGHKCWEQELGIWEHSAALRGSLVKIPADQRGFDAMRAEYDQLFSYDSEVLANPTNTPTFMRPCATTQAGTCIKDEHHEEYVALVGQFDAGLGKLGGSPLLLQLLATDGVEHWHALGGVCKRPLCHTVVGLYCSGNSLRMSLRNGMLHVCSMHQVFRNMLAIFCAAGGSVTEFRAEVRIYDDLLIDKSDSTQFGMERPSSLVAEFGIGFKPEADAVADRAKSSSVAPRLPFGMSLLVEPKKRAKKPQQTDDQQCDASEVSGKGQKEASAEEAWPTVLSPEAQTELDRALAADLAAREDDLPENQNKPAAASSASSSSAIMPVAASDPNLPPEHASQSTQSTYFQQELGISDLAPAKRKGVKCFHCEDPIDKGQYRHSAEASLAFSRSKPHRSIHLQCLVQLREEFVVNSIRFLERRMIDGRLPAVELQICQEALHTLRALAPLEPAA